MFEHASITAIADSCAVRLKYNTECSDKYCGTRVTLVGTNNITYNSATLVELWQCLYRSCSIDFHCFRESSALDNSDLFVMSEQYSLNLDMIVVFIVLT